MLRALTKSQRNYQQEYFKIMFLAILFFGNFIANGVMVTSKENGIIKPGLNSN